MVCVEGVVKKVSATQTDMIQVLGREACMVCKKQAEEKKKSI